MSLIWPSEVAECQRANGQCPGSVRKNTPNCTAGLLQTKRVNILAAVDDVLHVAKLLNDQSIFSLSSVLLGG